MKLTFKRLCFQLLLITGLASTLAGRVTAQTFTTVHSFSSLSAPYFNGGTNNDGALPNGGLMLSGNTLYGTTQYGGTSNGTVFKADIDGTGFTTLHTFTASSGSYPHLINSDGVGPYAGLILSGRTLYGTTPYGGAGGFGTVFAVNTDGTGFTNLHSFTESRYYRDGANPWARLILSGNTLYGTAISGGKWGLGTVFAVSIDGTGFTNLHSFTGTSGEGFSPMAGLILSGNALYGTTQNGGDYSAGTVFAVNIDGTGFTNLHNFNKSDGQSPLAELILSSNTLYGTASHGGSSANGTVFALNTNGTGFTTLHDFTATPASLQNTNNDGAVPITVLLLSGNALYGTTHFGGSLGAGTVFAVNIDGSGFRSLYSFSQISGPLGTNGDGAFPQAGLLLSSNTLYGMAHGGGTNGNGTVFSLSTPPPPPPPLLTIIRSGAKVILTWPTSAIGFSLQSTPSLAAPVWTSVTSSPVVVNGQNAVTNPVSFSQQFFRLSQ